MHHGLRGGWMPLTMNTCTIVHIYILCNVCNPVFQHHVDVLAYNYIHANSPNTYMHSYINSDKTYFLIHALFSIQSFIVATNVPSNFLKSVCT